MTPALGTLNWHSFLARPAIPAPAPSLVRQLTGKPILITGAAGSIGSALVDRLAAGGAHLILLESSETNLFDLQTSFQEPRGMICYLGSAGDRPLLTEIFAEHRPHLVFHAAAFKHVPLLEDQALAAIINNVFGTETLASVSSEHGARVVLLSTDKAIAPASIMGATKRISEHIVLGSNGIVVRLGNVLGSRGSVSEVFARNIAAGLPLAVTHPAARRYFLTVDEAVNLLITAAAEPSPPALLAPSLSSPHYISDLARFMSDNLAPGREIGIEFTHLRPGDKEDEQLWSAEEVVGRATSEHLVSLQSPIAAPFKLRNGLGSLRNAVMARDLPAAIAIIASLVPDYTPSSTILASSASISSQASHD